MSEAEDPRDKPDKRVPYEENVPSSRILKLAILAAAIIVIIAIVLYLKARHQPPALRDQLRGTPAQTYAAKESTRWIALPSVNFQEAPSWIPRQTANLIRSS
ncbi:MAG: hypothetical protein ACYDDI_16960 [Candidatus Acidiferrales bacterium]